MTIRKRELTEKQRKVRSVLEIISLPLYLFAMLLLDQLFLKLYGFVGGVSWPDRQELLFSLLWVLAFGAIVWLLPRLGGRIFMILSVVLSCLLVAAHAVLYHLFGSFFRFSDLLYAGDGAAFFSLKYLHMRLLLLAGILLTLGAGITAAVFLPKRRYSVWRILIGTAVLVLAALGLMKLNRQNLTEIRKVEEEMHWDIDQEKNSADMQRKLLYTEFQNPNACLPMTGLYQYTFRDFGKTFFSASGKDINQHRKELNDYYSSRPAHEANEMTGALQGKNVIMIMVESLDSWMITEEYMPNLYALQQKSVSFNHFYTPLYLKAGTFATEFTTMSGIVPPANGISTDAYVENTLPATLPKLFAREGYIANSFHSANPNIYDRGRIHSNLGFLAYHNHQKMGMSDYMVDTQLINAFDQMVNTEEPFFSFVITYSGHGPYTDQFDNIAAAHLDDARRAVAASGVTGSEDTMEQFTRAVAHIMVTDDYIGDLVKHLQEAGLLENTALVIYGDHFCKYITDTDFLLRLKSVPNRNLLCNTPLLIYQQDLEPRVVEKYASSADLFPTVCNLWGLDADLRYFVGDDIFSDRGGMIYWPDNSCYDGKTYVDGGKTAGMTAEEQQMYETAWRRLNMSWDTMRYDFFSAVVPIRQEP